MLVVWNALDFKLYNRTRHKRHVKAEERLLCNLI